MDAQDEATLAIIKAADELFVPCRWGVFPRWNNIGVLDGGTFHSFSAWDLFEMLGIPRARLAEVYEYDERRVKPADLADPDPREAGVLGFTGAFRPDGMQRLADLLGKTIEFWRQPHSEPECTQMIGKFEPRTPT